MTASGETHAPVVHGLAGDRVSPDWPPLRDRETQRILGRWSLPGAASARVIWHSPRPLSAAGLVRCGAQAVFVKRHDRRVRDPASLAIEHRFATHLRGRGIEVPAIHATADGETAVESDGSVYEVHAAADGDDLYRDAESWTGFADRAHAVAAGAALARLHLAAESFTDPPRPFGPLVDSCEITTAADPAATLGALVAHRPGLAAGLAPYAWERDVVRDLAPAMARAGERARPLAAHWTHGDWHPSNLTWSGDGRPATVLDLGLCNRTLLVRDIAIAIERSCISWLGPTPAADLDAVSALLRGYVSARPLSEAESSALPELTAVVHVEFALSEVEYYGGVLGSPARADVAYRDYLLGHARWFDSDAGRRLLDHLRGR